MTDLRTAAQQALEALEMSRRFVYADNRPQCDDAIDVLRAALAQQAEPKGGGRLPPPLQAEPVLVVEKEPDYWSRGHFHQGSKPHIDPTKVWNLPIGTKLYTAPPQRKPLTKERFLYIYNQLPNWGMDMDSLPQGLEKFARAVERAHGIGGQP